MQTIKQRISACQNHLVKKTNSLSEKALIRVFAGLAFFITLWAVYIQQGAINADSVLYFEAARLFSIGEWHQGFTLFPWPLYSMLIAALHNLIGLSFHSSAQLLTAVFFAITITSFVTLIRLAGGNRTTAICGATLLLSSSYIVGDVLPMLLRDQGFWAFLLTGLVFFIKFYRDGKLQNALLWQASCVLAMLFRIEGVTFLALLPFVLFADTTLARKERLTRFIKAHTLNLLMATALLAMLIAMPSLSPTDLGRLQEIWVLLTQGFQLISEQFSEKSMVMGNEVLGPYLDNYGSIGLSIALIGIVLIKAINTAGWVSIGLIALGIKDKKLNIDPDAKRIFIFVSCLALLNAATVLLRSYVLSSRYIVALAFILLIFSSFGFAALFNPNKTAKKNPKKWLVVIVIVLLCLGLLRNIVPKRQGYAYEKEAVEWVKQNTPKNSAIFYVSPKARYYAGEPYAGRYYEYWDYVMQAIKDGSIGQYDYLVINLDKEDLDKQKRLEEALRDHVLTREFVGYKGKKKILFFSRK